MLRLCLLDVPLDSSSAVRSSSRNLRLSYLGSGAVAALRQHGDREEGWFGEAQRGFIIDVLNEHISIDHGNMSRMGCFPLTGQQDASQLRRWQPAGWSRIVTDGQKQAVASQRRLGGGLCCEIDSRHDGRVDFLDETQQGRSRELYVPLRLYNAPPSACVTVLLISTPENPNSDKRPGSSGFRSHPAVGFTVRLFPHIDVHGSLP